MMLAHASSVASSHAKTSSSFMPASAQAARDEIQHARQLVKVAGDKQFCHEPASDYQAPTASVALSKVWNISRMPASSSTSTILGDMAAR